MKFFTLLSSIFLFTFFVNTSSTYASELDSSSTYSAFRKRMTTVQSSEDAYRRSAKLRSDYSSGEAKERLQNISDEQKRKIIEQIEQIMAHINERWTTHFMNVLDRLDLILAKIEDRTGGGAEIDEAAQAIADAREAVEAQAAKEYLVEVGEDESLRTNAGESIQKLKADLAETREMVRKAREAVHQAFQVLKPELEQDETN